MSIIKATLVAAMGFFLVACSQAPPPAPAEPAKPAPIGTIVRLDPAIDALIPQDAQLEKLAGGFTFTEGPIWRPPDVLEFSDVIGNVVRQYNATTGQVTVFLDPGGYDGKGNLPAGGFNGPNGSTADKDGAVLLCQHGYRRIVRIAKDKTITTVVDRYQGKRLNSPNDVVFRSDGAFYFTDPPYGLPKMDDDPAKELKFNGVFRYDKGKLTPVIKDLTRPNGIAFSPDQKTLYIGNTDEKNKVWMAYDVADNGTVSNGRVFYNATSEKEDGLPDGLKIDEKGDMWASGPGGLWIFSPDGKHIGTIKMPEIPANCNWGDDWKSLYITARTGLYRIKLSVAGEKQLYQ